MTYRGMDKAALDAAYDNGKAVGSERRDRYLADWTRRTKELAARSGALTGLAYGPAPRHRIDFYPCGSTGAPTLVFIHGGYWQFSDKENYGCVAEGPLAHGINVALVEYRLAPAVRMDAIVAEVRRALDWLKVNLGRLDAATDGIIVSGHSAGGHLTAMMITELGVIGAMPISGLFDLEPLRQSYINDKVGMDEDEARRNSPLLHIPSAAAPQAVAVGGNELPELRRQSAEYHAALAARGLSSRLLQLDGHDHFSVLEELASPAGQLTAAVRDLIDGAPR
ncbi:MAG TPA: alpha/beta hydrolase [Stellaceae bacterium]|nr:alpha/beta hydrolase [Stellaceae bacterium]